MFGILGKYPALLRSPILFSLNQRVHWLYRLRKAEPRWSLKKYYRMESVRLSSINSRLPPIAFEHIFPAMEVARTIPGRCGRGASESQRGNTLHNSIPVHGGPLLILIS